MALYKTKSPRDNVPAGTIVRYNPSGAQVPDPTTPTPVDPPVGGSLLSTAQAGSTSTAGFLVRGTTGGATLTATNVGGVNVIRCATTSTSSTSTGIATNPPVAVTPNTPYTMSVRVKNTSVDKKFVLRLLWLDSKGTAIIGSPSGNPTTVAIGAEVLMSSKVTAPPTAATVQAVIQCESNPGSGKFYDTRDWSLIKSGDTKVDNTRYVLGYTKPVNGMFPAANSHWALDVRSAPVHPNSATLINTMVTTDLAPTVFNGIAVFNTDQFNSTTYVVSASHPRINIGFCDAQRKGLTPGDLYSNEGIYKAFRDVPVPTGAVSGGGGDGHVAIYCPETDQMWEFWQFWEDRQQDNGYGGVTPEAAAAGNFTYQPKEVVQKNWHGFSATWGGRIDNVSTDRGTFPGFTGTTATGLAMQGGNIGIAEAQTGVINHALALSLVYPRIYTTYSYPAKRSDGFVNSAKNIPEGLRLRMDNTINFDTQYPSLHPLARMAAKALQKYGGIVVDKSGGVEIEAESAASVKRLGMTDPWVALLAGTPSYNVMAGFPWDRMQALEFDYGKP